MGIKANRPQEPYDPKRRGDNPHKLKPAAPPAFYPNETKPKVAPAAPPAGPPPPPPPKGPTNPNEGKPKFPKKNPGPKKPWEKAKPPQRPWDNEKPWEK